MGSFRDADNEYIILVDATGASALDVTKGTITALSLSGQLFKYLQKASLLSANQDRSFFYFESSMLTQVQVVNSTASALYGASRHICSSNQDSVTIKYDPCQQPVKWLKTGLVANETIVLFDSDNSVAVFDTSDYIARTGKPVTLRKTAANKFWTKFELRFTPDPSIPPLFSGTVPSPVTYFTRLTHPPFNRTLLDAILPHHTDPDRIPLPWRRSLLRLRVLLQPAATASRCRTPAAATSQSWPSCSLSNSPPFCNILLLFLLIKL